MVGEKIKIYRVQITGKCICETIIESRRLHSCPPLQNSPPCLLLPPGSGKLLTPTQTAFCLISILPS